MDSEWTAVPCSANVSGQKVVKGRMYTLWDLVLLDTTSCI
jgi:hypothetical protein